MTTSENTSALIEAASASWDRIAAFAWQSYRLGGRGAVLVLAADLLQAAAAPGLDGGAGGGEGADGGGEAGGEGDALPLNYFARDDIPSGDDFRSLMDSYDPETQVMLMIGGDDGEQVLVLEAREGGRRPPRSFE